MARPRGFLLKRGQGPHIRQGLRARLEPTEAVCASAVARAKQRRTSGHPRGPKAQVRQGQVHQDGNPDERREDSGAGNTSTRQAAQAADRDFQARVAAGEREAKGPRQGRQGGRAASRAQGGGASLQPAGRALHQRTCRSPGVAVAGRFRARTESPARRRVNGEKRRRPPDRDEGRKPKPDGCHAKERLERFEGRERPHGHQEAPPALRQGPGGPELHLERD